MENLDKIIENCNLIISKRIGGGYHFEFPPSTRFCVVCWSNAKGGYWYLSGQKTRYYRKEARNELHPIIKLGCEEILLPYPKMIVEKIIDQLHPFPL